MEHDAVYESASTSRCEYRTRDSDFSTADTDEETWFPNYSFASVLPTTLLESTPSAVRSLPTPTLVGEPREVRDVVVDDHREVEHRVGLLD